nr:hypothetical protein [Marinicella sp. W31]MDC2879776.1 hypothetical protein [Marinicella sp. W31]
MSFRVLDFPDLTVDGSFPLGAAVSAAAIVNGIDPFIATFFGMLAGAAAGFVTGLLNVRFGIMNLLAGILSMVALFPSICASWDARTCRFTARTPCSHASKAWSMQGCGATRSCF